MPAVPCERLGIWASRLSVWKRGGTMCQLEPVGSCSASATSTAAACSATPVAPATPDRRAHSAPSRTPAVPRVRSWTRAPGRYRGGRQIVWGQPSGSASAASRATTGSAPAASSATSTPRELTSPSKKVQSVWVGVTSRTRSTIASARRCSSVVQGRPRRISASTRASPPTPLCTPSRSHAASVTSGTVADAGIHGPSSQRTLVQHPPPRRLRDSEVHLRGPRCHLAR